MIVLEKIYHFSAIKKRIQEEWQMEGIGMFLCIDLKLL